MSQEVINLSEIIKDLQPFYSKIYEPLLQGRSSSLVGLISDLNGWIRNEHWNSMNEKTRLNYEEAYQNAKTKFEFFTWKLYYYIIAALDSLIKANIKLPRENAETFMRLLTKPLDVITEEVINGWFVDVVRKICRGELKEKIYDGYNYFRDKWNSTLNEIENTCSRFGLNLEVSARAKDLGAKAVP